MSALPASRRIGFVGMGNMGIPMAACLVNRGFDVAVNDIDPAASARFCAAHKAKALSRTEIARHSDILILMLPNGKIVRDYLLEGGINEAPLHLMAPGSVVIDMSSSAPTGTQEVGRILAEKNIHFVDAPVSGGVSRAKTGQLAIITGGDETVLRDLQPVFDAMARSVIHVGTLGSGHAMKALNNYVSAMGLLASCEALRVAQQFGIKGERAVEVLNASTGKNNSTEHKLAQFVLSGTYSSGFTLGLMRKDLATALALAKEMSVDIPLGERCIDIWQQAEKSLGGAADHTEIDRMIQLPDDKRPSRTI